MTFWDRVDVGNPEECWPWLGHRDTPGYGTLRVEGRTVGAHRLAYELTVGPIPDGLQIDHLCRVRHCVNPAHMEPVTPRENILRSPVALAAINARKTHCPQGHPLSGANLYRTPQGFRACRECRRKSDRESKRRTYWARKEAI